MTLYYSTATPRPCELARGTTERWVPGGLARAGLQSPGSPLPTGDGKPSPYGLCIITHGAKTGNLIVPADLLPGSYKLTVTAEDTAHNLDSQEATMEVLPWVRAGGD